MTDQIKNLYRQALTKTAGEGEETMVYMLAELVAQECVKVCDDVGVALFAEPHQSNLTTAQTCALAIKKHFGVES